MDKAQSWMDQPGEMRAEDALPLEALSNFLAREMPKFDKITGIRQFKGGASNLTYQITCGQEELILRCAPAGTKAKSAHNMEREYQIMRQLKPFFPAVPDTFAFCHDEAVIGRPFYLMEKKRGVILRANLPKGMIMNPLAVKTLCCNALDQLIALHSVDCEKAGLNTFGKGEGYIKRQVEGWSERYRNARTWNVPGFEGVMDWLGANMPVTTYMCFIHNDFRFDNLVLSADNPQEITGVLDWEMATMGDRFMDIGNSLAYWVQADDDFVFKSFRRQPTHLPGMLTRREVVDYYSKKTGIYPADFKFYEVYGLFRLAAIAQQIYYRYHHKQTKNPAFRHFWLLIHYLHYRCKKAMRGGLSR